MITIYGRNKDRFRKSRTPPLGGEIAIKTEPMPGVVVWSVEQPGVKIAGKTLGEILSAYCSLENIEIIPHDQPKYFRYIGEDCKSEEGYCLVDIHITRNTEEICPKQNLEFPMQDGDIVEILALIC
jgi:hypothetical protein